MAKYDLVLIHPPNIYDFREKFVLYGPISDVIPSTPVFETYPLGFITLANYLDKEGYNVVISNLAMKMLKNKNFDLERYLRKLDANVYGLDLHWLVHAHGALETAKIIKKNHPDRKVLFGGLTSTYYHREIMENFGQVDFVIRGDTAEEPLKSLLEKLERNKPLKDVPNLTWRGEDGKVRVNPQTFIPEDIDKYVMDYRVLFKSIFKQKDLTSHLPYQNWFEKPLTAVFTVKGCFFNCVTCGGSCFAYKRFYGRVKPVFKSADTLLEEIKIIGEYSNIPIFIVGDIRLGGKKRLDKFLKGLKEEGIENPLIYELFYPGTRKFLAELAKSTPVGLEISPESHDEKIRFKQGRKYTTKPLEKSIKEALKLGFLKVDVFFMIGLPMQNRGSVIENIGYIEKLIRENKGDQRFHPFIAPLAPFLDPGSLAFEKPAVYGYKVLRETLRQHVESMEMPSWKYFLNYETKWMTRDQIVDLTYESAYLLNKLKEKHGLIDEDEAHKIEGKIQLTYSVMRKIDELVQLGGINHVKLIKLKAKVENNDSEILCPKEELWPTYKANITLKIMKRISRVLRL